LHKTGRFVRLILGVIAEHVRQHLGVKDTARRRDEGAEALLVVESITQADALGGEMRGRDAPTLTMAADQITLLRASFDKLWPVNQRFAETFYARLF